MHSTWISSHFTVQNLTQCLLCRDGILSYAVYHMNIKLLFKFFISAVLMEMVCHILLVHLVLAMVALEG